MKQKYLTLVTAVVALLVLLVAALIAIQLLNPYKHVEVVEGVEFLSNERTPTEQLRLLSEKRLFIVSPELYESGTANSYMAGSLTLFNTVLGASNRNTVTVARVISPDGELLYCQSNMGDPSTNEQITLEECNAWLGNEDYVRIKISMPDLSLARPRVIALQNEILVQPHSFPSIAPTSATTLKQMFPNTGEIVDEINSLLVNLQ